MKIAIIVGGRFHSDQMAEALLEAGHDVRVYTSLPRNRFANIARERVVSFVEYEVVFRAASRLGFENAGDLWKMKNFGARVARTLKPWNPDAIVSWSSFAIESFREFPQAFKIVVRDSAHIVEQLKMYESEFERAGINPPDRSRCIARELEEYSASDKILVCSNFIKDTFIRRGFSPEKIHSIPLGVDTHHFFPKQNFSAKLPLRVVYFGGISLYKGVYYLLEATQGSSQFAVTLIGQVSRDFQSILEKFPQAKVFPPMPHAALAEKLRTMDVFVMPSLQDGWGAVVPQAMASGLACVVTTNCGSRELIRHGVNGMLIPPASSHAIRNVLAELAGNTAKVNTLGQNAASQSPQLSWKHYQAAVSSWIADSIASALTHLQPPPAREKIG